MTQPPHDEPTAADPGELREQVEQTRRRLGDTVQELAGRTDIRARAQEKAAAVREQTAAARGQAVALRERTAAKASELTGQARARAAVTADRAGQVWQDKAPEPVRDRRAALLAAGAALLAACVLLRRKR